MKKTIFIIMMSIFVVSFAACNKKSSLNITSTEESTAEISTEEETEETIIGDDATTEETREEETSVEETTTKAASVTTEKSAVKITAAAKTETAAAATEKKTEIVVKTPSRVEVPTSDAELKAYMEKLFTPEGSGNVIIDSRLGSIDLKASVDWTIYENILRILGVENIDRGTTSNPGAGETGSYISGVYGPEKREIRVTYYSHESFIQRPGANLSVTYSVGLPSKETKEFMEKTFLPEGLHVLGSSELGSLYFGVKSNDSYASSDFLTKTLEAIATRPIESSYYRTTYGPNDRQIAIFPAYYSGYEGPDPNLLYYQIIY